MRDRHAELGLSLRGRAAPRRPGPDEPDDADGFSRVAR
jgi:hypothetical protein